MKPLSFWKETYLVLHIIHVTLLCSGIMVENLLNDET